MANTYTLIASNTVGSGGSALVTFSSIPSTYTDLMLRHSSRTDTTDARIKIGLNANINFSWTSLYNFDGSLISQTGSYGYGGVASTSDFTASTFGNIDIYIPKYGATVAHSFSVDSVNETNSSSIDQIFLAGLRNNTDPITTIDVFPFTGNFVQYSTFYLYGIKNS